MRNWQSVGASYSPVNSKGLDCPTLRNSPVENIGENSVLTNPEKGRESDTPASNWKVIESVLGESAMASLNQARALQAAIDACDPTLAAIIMDRELDALRIGAPGAAFLSAMDEARFWADFTTPAELKAYLLACFEKMSHEDRLGFLRYAKRNIDENGMWRASA